MTGAPPITEKVEMKHLLTALSMFTLSASTAAAQFITPTGTFSANPPAGVTFGGSGIPGPVMTTTLMNGGPLLVIGASQRFDNAALSNNGAGSYSATRGNDVSSSPVAGYASWNFNYYVGGQNSAAYDYRLYYDFNPAAGGLQPSFGFVNLVGSSLPTNGVSQNSWNLGMNFLTAGISNVVVPPPSLSFNALSAGTYSFALVAYQSVPNGSTEMQFATEVGRVAMDVNVVPEPASIVLMVTGLIGTGLIVRRRRRAAVTAQI